MEALLLLRDRSIRRTVVIYKKRLFIFCFSQDEKHNENTNKALPFMSWNKTLVLLPQLMGTNVMDLMWWLYCVVKLNVGCCRLWTWPLPAVLNPHLSSKLIPGLFFSFAKVLAILLIKMLLHRWCRKVLYSQHPCTRLLPGVLFSGHTLHC